MLFYIDGKQQAKTVKGTKREAERMLREIERQIDQGEYRDKPKKVVTVGDVLREWLSGVKERRTITTYETYERSVRNWLLPAFGELPLSGLSPAAIEAAYREWGERGSSPQSILNRHTPLSATLKYAMKRGYVSCNAASLADLPSRDEKDKTVLDDDTIRRLVIDAHSNQYGPHAALAVMTGMRLGEVCALKWEDVDMEKREIMVVRSAARSAGRVILKAPKTRSSRRPISLSVGTVGLLKGLPRRGEFVFGGDSPPNPATVSAGVCDLCRRWGVTMHGLRHSHASQLNRMGENIKLVQERMGHSSIKETMDTYTHTLPSQQGGMAERLDDKMRG